ncbi:hypothetical protein [Stenotrophomonas geniculata]|uniref:hypothetical protein n=1 Tax=Stenotrophomonas geniculata TaxID=86188 RepID=UPI001F19DA54|nr:hypothetical protein [Stenotrophomonas geniculata]MCF3502368.1 hypothetical protein [Stenotrophomonas maltophilia]
MAAISFPLMLALLSAQAPMAANAERDYTGPTGASSIGPGICDPGMDMLPNGGGVVIRRCGKNGTVAGVGSNIDAATANTNGFLAVAEEGPVCSVFARDPYVSLPAPGVGIKAQCSSTPLSAYGMTTTTAGQNVLELAINLAATQAWCNVDYYNGSAHGYKYPYTCNRPGQSWSVAGLGSSVDDANAMAMRLVKKSSKTGTHCYFDNAELNGVVFRAYLHCNGSTYTGFGSSVTAAAKDAAAQAGA